MEQISVSTIMWFVCLWFSVVMCSEPSDAMIKTYVSSSLPSNDDLVDSAMLLQLHKITSDSEWESLVIQSSLPVMVLFMDEQCGQHCERLRNIMENLERGYYNDKFKFYTINIYELQFIAFSYGVTTTPTTIVFKGGNFMEGIEGFFPGKLEQLVHKYA